MDNHKWDGEKSKIEETFVTHKSKKSCDMGEGGIKKSGYTYDFIYEQLLKYFCYRYMLSYTLDKTLNLPSNHPWCNKIINSGQNFLLDFPSSTENLKDFLSKLS